MRCLTLLACVFALGTLLACGGGQDNPDIDDTGSDVAGHDAIDAVDAPDGTGPVDVRDASDTEEPLDTIDTADADDAPTPDDATDAADGETDVPDTAECPVPLPLACGDSFNHSTVTNGRANLWSGYGCTARLENGRETVYRLVTENDCLATVTLSNLETDLDVMRLTACDPWAATDCESTPVDIQDDEIISFLTLAHENNYVVVDGYDGSEGSYTIDVDCDCGEPTPGYLSFMVECAFQYVDSTPTTPETPESAPCLPEPCTDNADCTAINTVGAGTQCVMGNCVYCAEDTDCPEANVCRAGRCVEKGAVTCPEIPDCAAAGCGQAEISETSCPTCLCTTEFFNSCSKDDDCLVISHHLFRRCVNGRCAECRVDADCDNEALQCLPPGMCMSLLTHPSAIYGSWVIGWYGGLNHFSYFRFEHDGTLRRGSYDTAGPAGWADDIFLGSCPGASDSGEPAPLVGTWEPVMTESGFLVISVDFQAICNPGAPVLTRWLVTMDESGDGFTMKSVEFPDGIQLTGVRIAPEIFCNSEFTSCMAPDYAIF